MLEVRWTKEHPRVDSEYASHVLEIPYAGSHPLLHWHVEATSWVLGRLIHIPVTEVEHTGASSQFYDKFSKVNLLLVVVFVTDQIIFRCTVGNMVAAKRDCCS